MKYQSGDVVLINIGDERRYVVILLTECDEESGCCRTGEPTTNPIYNVALTNNEFDLITDQDVILRPEEIGLPFPLVVLGIVGPVRVEEYAVPNREVGKIIPEIYEELRPFIYLGEPSPILSPRSGIPLRGEADPRWKFMEDELYLMQKVFVPWEDWED